MTWLALSARPYIGVGAFAAAVTDYRHRAGALATALYPPAAAAAGAAGLDAKLVAVLGAAGSAWQILFATSSNACLTLEVHDIS